MRRLVLILLLVSGIPCGAAGTTFPGLSLRNNAGAESRRVVLLVNVEVVDVSAKKEWRSFCGNENLFCKGHDLARGNQIVSRKSFPSAGIDKLIWQRIDFLDLSINLSWRSDGATIIADVENDLCFFDASVRVFHDFHTARADDYVGPFDFDHRPFGDVGGLLGSLRNQPICVDQSVRLFTCRSHLIQLTLHDAQLIVENQGAYYPGHSNDRGQHQHQNFSIGHKNTLALGLYLAGFYAMFGSLFCLVVGAKGHAGRASYFCGFAVLLVLSVLILHIAVSFQFSQTQPCAARSKRPVPDFQRPSNAKDCVPTPLPTPIPTPIPTSANALPTTFLPSPYNPLPLEGTAAALEGLAGLPRLPSHGSRIQLATERG